MLYSDDVVFSVGDTVKSIRALYKILDSFGEVSGYKINPAKLAVLAFHISSNERDIMQQVINISWKEQVKYLGVNIVPSLEMNKLIFLNVSPLIKKTQRNFAEWDKLRISWFGRVLAVKMKILPRFIFIF